MSQPAEPLVPADPGQPSWRLLPVILGLAFAARVGVVLGGDFIYHPDVVFQYLEPAWRLVSGHGLVVWEQYYGARSQLVPTFLAGVMWALLGLTEHPAALRTSVEIVLCGVSLLIPWGMYAFARAVFEERVGRVALVLGAAWYELVALAGQPLSEMLAICPLLWAFALAANVRTYRRAAALGVLVVLASALRIQYAPLALVGAAYAFVAAAPPMRLRLLRAAAVTVGLVALFDLATVGAPLFRSYTANLTFNAVFAEEAVRSGLGMPWWFQLAALSFLSGGLFVAAVMGAFVRPPRRGEAHPAHRRGVAHAAPKWLAAPMAVVLAVHALSPWQEYRFVLVTAPFWLTGLGAVVTSLWLRRGYGRCVATLCGIWFLAVSMGGLLGKLPGHSVLHGSRPVALHFLGSPDPRLAFADRLAEDDSLTSLAQLVGLWVGHVHLGRTVPAVPMFYGGVVEALRGCGLQPRHYASHAMLPPGSSLPAGFRTTLRDHDGGWRLAERVGAARPGSPPAWVVPGSVAVVGDWGRVARWIFEAGPAKAQSWPVSLWRWWEGTWGQAGPIAPFRVHGSDGRSAPARVPLASACRCQTGSLRAGGCSA